MFLISIYAASMPELSYASLISFRYYLLYLNTFVLPLRNIRPFRRVSPKPLISKLLPLGAGTPSATRSSRTHFRACTPCKYQMLDVPLTRCKRQLLETEDAQLQDPYRQHRRASNITEAPHTFHSTSKKTAAKCWRGISRPISTLLTPL
jgi:hypothetical protein